MAEEYGRRLGASDVRTSAAVDQGLRSYMLKVYNYMASGVALTGLIAALFAGQLQQSPELVQAVYGSPLKWIIMLSPLAMVMVISFGVNKLSAFALQASFWVFASLMGLSLASIFLMYTGESIARVFFITAASFSALSLYGYTTKKDLTGWGSFLIMGVFGLIIASVVNIFMASSAMDFAISVIGVLIFAGLTAYDTQKIKKMYWEGDGHEVASKKAIMGALSLYLDFINMFLFLLRLFGSRN